MKFLHIAILAVLACLAAGQEPVSRYADELRRQNVQTQAVVAELLEMVRQNEKDPEVIASVGRRFLAEYDGAIGVMDRYRAATTRFGLQSEVDDLMQLHLAIQSGRSALNVLVEGHPPAPFSPRDISLAKQAFQEDIVPLIKEFVDQQLEAQGAADFLTDPGLDTAALIVVNHIGGEIRAAVDKEIEKIVGAKIRLGMSLKEHILMAARSWISRSVGGVLLRFAANHFVVERLGLKILEWIGPRLREFLRPKGNLEARVERAISGLNTRVGDLNRMDSEEDMQDVRRMVEAAENHIRANEFLRKDLNNAKENDLYKRLAEAEVKLLEAIKRAKVRFLMNSKFAEVFGQLTSDWKSGRKQAADLLDKLKAAPPAGAGGEYFAVAEGADRVRFPGEFRLTLDRTEAGFRIRVADPKGQVLANHDFKPDPSAPNDMFVSYEPVWPDGRPAYVSMRVLERDGDGSPKSGWMQWWTREATQGLLMIRYQKRSGMMLPYAGSYRSASDKDRFGVPDPFRVELSPVGSGFKLRVIDAQNRVIANAELKLVRENKSSGGQVRSRVYEAAGGAWIDGAPLAKIMMTSDHFEDDGTTPNRGVVSWFASEGNRLVMQIAFRRVG